MNTKTETFTVIQSKLSKNYFKPADFEAPCNRRTWSSCRCRRSDQTLYPRTEPIRRRPKSRASFTIFFQLSICICCLLTKSQTQVFKCKILWLNGYQLGDCVPLTVSINVDFHEIFAKIDVRKFRKFLYLLLSLRRFGRNPCQNPENLTKIFEKQGNKNVRNPCLNMNQNYRK